MPFVYGLGLGPRVVDIIHRKTAQNDFGRIAAILGQYAQQLDVMFLEEWQHP
jgi:hypothetical protein